MGRRIHSPWAPDTGHHWTLAEAARACARENTHRFPDPPERQEAHADTDVDGVRQVVAASREIVRCRDCRRVLFVTRHGRPWGPARVNGQREVPAGGHQKSPPRRAD